MNKGLIAALLICIGPVSIMFFLQGFNVIPFQSQGVMGVITGVSFIASLVVAKLTGNL